MKQSKIAKSRKQIVGILLTLALITVLLFSGPASAVELYLSAPSSMNPGQTKNIRVAVDLEDVDEQIPVKYLDLRLENIQNSNDVYNCRFNPNGEKISCDSAFGTITQAQNTGYGYSLDMWGYGYGYSTPPTATETNTSFGPGYGYGYTAGYSTATTPYGEMSFNVQWTAPTGTTQRYEVTFSAYAESTNGSVNYTYIYASNPRILVDDSSSGSSSSSSDDDDDDDDTTDDTTTDDSGTGDSGSGDSGTTDNAENDRIDAVKKTLPAGYDKVEKEQTTEQKVVYTKEQLVETINKAIEEATNEEAKQALTQMKTALEQSEAKEITVTKQLNVYKGTDTSRGVSTYRSVVTLSFKADKDMKDVKIVEVIPKSVANDVSELTFGDLKPTVLQADPIVQWEFASVAAGEEKDLSYVVNKKLDSVESTTVSTGDEVETPAQTGGEDTTPTTGEEDTTPAQTGGEDTTPQTPSTPVKPGFPWLWVILALVVIGGAVGFFMWKKQQ